MNASNNPLRLIGLSLLGVIILLVVCWNLYTSSQQHALYTAIMQEIARPNPGPEPRPQVQVFFIQINGKDPSQNFLARYKNLPFSVRPASQGVRRRVPDGNRDFNFQDQTTGEIGCALNFKGIVWKGLKPTVFSGNRIFEMAKVNGSWQVERQAEIAIVL